MKSCRPRAAGSAARPSGCRPPRSPWRPWPLLGWRRTAASWRGGLASAARAAPTSAADDLPNRGDTEAAVFDVAPAVDFAKHRTELGVRDLQPVAQRLDRTAAPVGVTGDGEALAGAIKDHLGRGGGEADMFDIETYQGSGAAAADGHQEQQRAIAQSGQVAAAGPGQAQQLGRRWPRRAA